MDLTLNSRIRLFSIVVALASVFFGASESRAAESAQPVDVAARIAAMQQKVTDATTKITTRQTNGITKVQQLDAAGAKNGAIEAAGRVAIRGIEEAAQTGRRQVSAIAETTIRQLKRQKAEQTVIDQVKAAREADNTAITQAAAAAKDAVRAAVTTAKGNNG